MSALPSALSADWDRVRKSLAVICVSHEELDRFFASTFDQLEALSNELLQRQRAFLAEREQAEHELERQARLLEQQRAALATQLEEVSQQRPSSGAVEAVLAPEACQELQRMLEETAEQRATLCQAQQVVEAQATRLAELTDKLLQSQKELLQAQSEIQKEREALAASRAEAARTEPASDASGDELREQLEQLQEERAALAQERTVLEAELESVRSRAAELAEHLAQQQRQMAEDRNQWAEELKYLRRLVERLAQQNTDRDTVTVASRATTSPPEAGQSAEPPSSAGDPVLSSVMAQFAMLQKDLQRRKAAHAESK